MKYDLNPPAKIVRLVFIHHSCGNKWLRDDNGGLGIALAGSKYYISDTNYGWGPDAIGDHTYTGHWWSWFRGEKSNIYLDALYSESGRHSKYSGLTEAPAGENEIIMFKSCYPNSNYKGSPNEPIPPISKNPLCGQDYDTEYHTISNAKGIYLDLLEYFKTRQDKLFIAVTSPPVSDGKWSENARLFNNWLVYEWLKDYPYKNIGVFDFYNILTSNGGSSEVNDLENDRGNHHYFKDGAISHVVGEACNTNKYPVEEGNDHPSRAGNLKATAEFIDILNIYYNKWCDI